MEWYGQTGAVAQAAFLRALESALDQLALFPRSGAAVGRSEARQILLTGHPYWLVYALRGNTIVLLALAHTSRRPRYWKKRLADGER